MVEIPEKTIMDMQRQVDACSSYIDALAKGYQSPEKINTLLDAAMQKLELCCIELRSLCESIRPPMPELQTRPLYHTDKVYGGITLMDNGWVHIRLGALLPHCRVTGGTQYVSDTLTRLLDTFQSAGGVLPLFEKAFLVIVEHRPKAQYGAFDSDNKGFKAVVNALKGRLYPDDDQFEVSLALFTVEDEDIGCHIYVMPEEEAGDFLYQMSDGSL